jgi:hypothetical protein
MVSKVIFYISQYKEVSIKEATDYVNNLRTTDPYEYEWLCAVARTWVGSSHYEWTGLFHAFGALKNAILDIFAKAIGL